MVSNKWYPIYFLLNGAFNLGYKFNSFSNIMGANLIGVFLNSYNNYFLYFQVVRVGFDPNVEAPYDEYVPLLLMTTDPVFKYKMNQKTCGKYVTLYRNEPRDVQFGFKEIEVIGKKQKMKNRNLQ